MFIFLFLKTKQSVHKDEVGCVDPAKCMAICESRTGCTNIALPKLVLEIMPSGKLVFYLLLLTFNRDSKRGKNRE